MLLTVCLSANFTNTAIAVNTAPPDLNIVMENDILRVSSNDGSVIKSITVYNLLGQPVYTESGCGQTVCDYDLSQLSPDIYIVVVNTDQGDTTKKINVK